MDVLVWICVSIGVCTCVLVLMCVSMGVCYYGCVSMDML